ncbi:MAG: ABC transporter permease [Myxococcota bacterium]
MSQRKRPGTIRTGTLIVRRELGQYTTTWSGYIITAGMLLVLGLAYNVWAVGAEARYSADVLNNFFYLASGITLVGGTLLSMRLIAEERSQGTYPMLATSALTEGQVIIAKYVAAMIPIIVFLALSVYMPLLIYVNGRVSAAHIGAGYLGLLLIGSAGVAIGLFGSSLVKSQLVAVIVSLIICGVGVLLWMTARIVDGPLGDILAGMTLHGRHFFPFQDGIISSANVIYYLSVTAFFLMLARNVLESRRWRP